jgi:hypothetical protein
MAMLDDDGVRALAVEVLRLAVSDLHGTHAARRRRAQNSINRQGDFARWCELAGVEADTVRQRLSRAPMKTVMDRPTQAR